ncbi:MAG TPA: hypothetical protein VHM70_29305 [Polyangiaceae bacterium]|jgi:hypothetical protein|nr:hypothetical protein [Polyangiaceae bacterium]
MTEQAIVQRRHIPRRHYWARVTTIVAGGWLLLSAFLWPHPYPLYTNTWVVGLGSFLLGVWAFRDPFARWISAALATWLVVIDILTWQTTPLTLWNNIIVSCIIFAASLIDGRHVRAIARS